jgi:hypothetical protein
LYIIFDDIHLKNGLHKRYFETRLLPINNLSDIKDDSKNELIKSILTCDLDNILIFNKDLNFFRINEFFNDFDDCMYDYESKNDMYDGIISYLYDNKLFINIKPTPNGHDSTSYINFSFNDKFIDDYNRFINMISIKYNETYCYDFNKIEQNITELITYISTDKYIEKILVKNNIKLQLLINNLHIIKENIIDLIKERMIISIIERFLCVSNNIKKYYKKKQNIICITINDNNLNLIDENSMIKCFPFLMKLQYFNKDFFSINYYKHISNSTINYIKCSICKNKFELKYNKSYIVSSNKKVYCEKCNDFIDIE